MDAHTKRKMHAALDRLLDQRSTAHDASTAQERAAEIARLKREHADVLNTPLYSEGAIGPAQTARFSSRQFKSLQEKQQKRLELESRIRELSKSDAVIAAQERSAASQKIASRRVQLQRQISDIERLGAMSHKPNGSLKIAYQRSYDAAMSELARLDAAERSL